MKVLCFVKNNSTYVEAITIYQMIRFLDLKNQICDGDASFAFYDTVREKIMSFGDDHQQVFDSVEEFVNNCDVDYETSKRLIGLIPKNFPQQSVRLHYNKSPKV